MVLSQSIVAGPLPKYTSHSFTIMRVHVSDSVLITFSCHAVILQVGAIDPSLLFK